MLGRRAAVAGRAAFGVLVIPFASDAFAEPAVALFRECDADGACWRVLTGAGRRDETPLQAARRETFLQTRVPTDSSYLVLDSRSTIPREGGGGCGLAEHAFAARVDPVALRPPPGRQLCWVSYDVALGLLQRDGERNALWELGRRLGWRAASG